MFLIKCVKSKTKSFFFPWELRFSNVFRKDNVALAKFAVYIYCTLKLTKKEMVEALNRMISIPFF